MRKKNQDIKKLLKDLFGVFTSKLSFKGHIGDVIMHLGSPNKEEIRFVFLSCGCLGSQHKHDNHVRPGPLGCGVKSQKYQFKNPCLTCNNRKSLRQNSELFFFLRIKTKL